MNEELKSLLRAWDVEEEYVKRIENAKIFKVTTLKLLDEDTIGKLIPDFGPQLEFKENLRKLRTTEYQFVPTSNVEDENGNCLSILVPTDTTKTVTLTTDVIPDIIMEGDEALEVQTDVTSKTSEKSAANQEPQSGLQCRLDTSFDLEMLLKSSITGRVLLSTYASRNDFIDKDRNTLGDLILSEFLKNDVYRKLSYSDEKAITDQILKQFPTEREGVWKSPQASCRQKAVGRGKLVVRYYHLRRIMLAANLIQRRPSDAGLNDNESETSGDENVATDDLRFEFEEKDLFLKNHKAPWSKVQTLWQETSKWRISKLLKSTVTIHDYVKQYPVLQEPTGYLLLETDFESMYPTSNMNLFIHWHRLSAFIKAKLMVASKKRADELEAALTDDGRKLRILRSLPYLFSPVTVVKKNKKNWRPSRAECSDSIIMHVKDSKDLQIDIEARRKKYAEFDLPMGPLAIAVGQDEDHIEASYLVVNSTTYEVDSPIKALDLAFKVTHALDAEYHKDVLRESLFLHHGIYNIPVKRGLKTKPLRDQKVIDAIQEYQKY